MRTVVDAAIEESARTATTTQQRQGQQQQPSEEALSSPPPRPKPQKTNHHHVSLATVVMDIFPWAWSLRRHRKEALSSGSGTLLLGIYDEHELKSHPLHYAVYESDFTTIRELTFAKPELLQQVLPSCGECPLHVACRISTTPRKMIEFLIQTDLRLNTASRGNSFVGAETTSLFIQSNETNGNNNTPLHLAAEQGSIDAVKVILVTTEISNVLKDALVGTNKDGNTALHLASLAGHLNVVESLLEAMSRLIHEMAAVVVVDNNNNNNSGGGGVNSSTTTTTTTTPVDHFSGRRNNGFSRPLYMKNNNGDLPIHLTLRLRHKRAPPASTTSSSSGSGIIMTNDKVPLWTALLLADNKLVEEEGERFTLHEPDEQSGLTAFEFFVQHPSHLTRDFVDEFLSKPVLTNYLKKGWQHLGGTKHWNIELAGSISRQPELQTIMTEACSNRLPVVTFMADFYAHFISIYVFYIATDNHLNNYIIRNTMLGKEAIPRNFLYVCAGYFLLREVIQWRLARKVYWTDVWNYLDLVRISLLITSANMLAKYDYDDETTYDMEYESIVRKVLLSTGVFLYLGALSFLRATFLPFALFVGGTSEIIITLIPFLVSFGMALLCIAYGFWVGGFSESTPEFEGDTYSDWLFTVFLRAMDGDGPSDFSHLEESYIKPYAWTLIFAILIQLLLLNILIAVIASEWEGVTARQTEVFWQYRLDFVAGSFPIQRGFLDWVTNSSPRIIRNITMALVNFADSADDIRILDSIHWDVFPYSVVRNEPKLYWDREALLTKLEGLEPRKSREELSGQLGVIRSFQADIAHCDTNTWCDYIRVLIRLVGYVFFWLFLFLLGCLTLGLMWPRRVRSFFFGQASSSWNVFQRGSSGGSNQQSGGSIMGESTKLTNHHQAHYMNSKDYSAMKQDFDKQFRTMTAQLNELNNAVDKLTSIVALSAEDRHREEETHHPRSLLRSTSIGSNSTKPPMRRVLEDDERSA